MKLTTRLSHLDAAQGAREERTEPYSNTVKGVPQQGNAAMRQEGQANLSFALVPGLVWRRV